MAINLKFDLTGNPEPPSIVLANRNGNKLGQLNVNVDSIDVSDKFNAASEFSFTLNKYIDDEPTPLWDKVVDFKLVYCPEWDLWFEIKVELDETTETVKTVFCTQLGQAELSQIKLYNIHINEEGDSNWDTNNETYKSTILYDPKNTDTSLLHRLLKDKAPHYSIAYVDESIQRIQKSFSFDDTSICDAFDEIEEEIGCLFVYNSNSTKGGKPSRTISVYDLQQQCNDCGHRGEFTDKCPKCESTNIKYGYGEDTTIFVTSDELATEGIQLVTDVDAVKNCFKLEGGDDLMTATIRNCNPNGSDYIWYFSDALKEDMSDELVEKLESYDDKYQDYYKNHISELNETSVNQYNALVDKYKEYYNAKSTCLNCGYEDYFEEKCPQCNSQNILNGQNLQTILTEIKGYPDLMTAYYNTIDLLLYLESGLMPKPDIETDKTDAKEQIELLTTSSLSPVAVNVREARDISETTSKSAVLSMAKVLIKSTYKVEAETLAFNDIVDADGVIVAKTWEGKFTVTNYSDDTDTATSDSISVTVNVDAETFIEQKIRKALNKENTDDYSISGLFAKEYDEFCEEIKKYALNPLDNFGKACDAVIGILVEQGVGDDGSNEDNEIDRATKKALYDALYKPYFDKQQAINTEIKTRQDEIAIIEGIWDKSDENNPRCTTDGLQQCIEKCQQDIQEALDFEKHLGEDLWLEFSAYRREDKYSNNNYVSDGLNNAELFERANEFIAIAEEEIFKSAELQHSISATLNNLLSLPKFKPLLKSFKTGNWIRVQVDDKIYKLRLLEYGFGYGKSESISVEFSDITKIKNGVTDVKDVLEQASSMASSYDAVQRQAEKGNVARSTIDQWIVDGLDSADVQIKSNDSEEIILTKSGLLARSYDDITGTYLPEQFKLTHNIMAYTDDNWETVSSALGKHSYNRWNGSSFIDDEGYGLTSKFVTAGYITGSQIIGGEIVSSNYEAKINGTYINLLNGDFDFAGGKIVYDSSDNEVKLKGVTIQWTGDDGVNAPEVKVENITGLDKYLEQLEDLENQLDGRTQTYSQSEDPSKSWTDEEKANHIGDLWLNPDSGITKRWTGIEWVEVTDSDLKELAQSKAQIFTDTPTPPYYIGDLWVQGSTGDIKHCIKNSEADATEFVESDWVISSKYTDDTEAIKAWNYADEAKKTGDRLVTGLGFQTTEITGNYIISPSIAGGYLNITNTNNNTGVVIDPNGLVNDDYIFRVYNGSTTAIGLDVDGNAEFSGTINGSHFIGGDLIIGDKDKVGDYAEIANDGTLTCTNVDILGGTLKIGRYEAKYEDGTPQLDEDGNQLYGWNTWIDEDGILKTNESVINGTIYAGAGSIGGFAIEPVKDEDGNTIGGWLYSSGKTFGEDKSIFLSAADMSGTVSNATLTNWRLAVGKHFGVVSDGTAYMSNCEITGGSLRMGTENGGYHTWITSDGVLNAQGANIDGSITAVNGNIGGWEITTNALYKNISGISSGMCSMQTKLVYYSEGLSYTLNSDKSSYTVRGIGSCVDTNVVIPSTYNAMPVTSIAHSAFSNRYNLTSVTIPDSVTSIGNGAFFGCSSLTSVVIPDNVTSIGVEMFYGCDNLTSVTIPDSVTSIGDAAFAWCRSLTSIVIPDSVTSIGVDAFYNCTSLTSVYYTGSEDDWNRVAISLGNSYLQDAIRYDYSSSELISNCVSLVNIGCISPPRFFAGSIHNIPNVIDEAKFLVLEDGSLYASAASIRGTIVANNGSIGGLTIADGLSYGDNFILNAEGFILKAKDSKIQTPNFSLYYNPKDNETIMQAESKLVMNGLSNGEVISSIQLLSEDGDSTIASEINLKTNGIHVSGVYYATFQITTINAPYTPISIEIEYQTGNKPWFDVNWKDTIYSALLTINGGSTESSVFRTLASNYNNGYIRYRIKGETDWLVSEQYVGGLIDGIIHENIATVETTKKNNNILLKGNLIPIDSNYSIGEYGRPYENLFITNINGEKLTTTTTYSGSSVIETSDEYKKNSILPLTDKYSLLFDKLNPISFKFNDGESGRTHIGLKAQDVKMSLDELNIDTVDFAPYCEWKDSDGNITCGIRYSELVSLNIYEIQKLKKRVAELENK